MVDEWLKYIDIVGYIDFDKFIKLPSMFIEYVIAVKIANNLKNIILKLQDEKDRDERKKLNIKLKELEGFFNE